MKKILFIVIVFITITSCTKNCTRTGCICKDNTSSNSTGTGACSGHGGVKQWVESCK